MGFGKEELPFPVSLFCHYRLCQRNVEELSLELLLFYAPDDRHCKSPFVGFIFDKLKKHRKFSVLFGKGVSYSFKAGSKGAYSTNKGLGTPKSRDITTCEYTFAKQYYQNHVMFILCIISFCIIIPVM
jgi:hypothetical protein